MRNHEDVSFEGIAGLTPAGSTYADVVGLLGAPEALERRDDLVLDGRLFSGYLSLLYPAQGLEVVFPSARVDAGSPVGVVLAVPGCRLRTKEGLVVGMGRAEALAIVGREYRVRQQGEHVVQLLPLGGKRGCTELGVGFEDGRVAYLGLYRR